MVISEYAISSYFWCPSKLLSFREQTEKSDAISRMNYYSRCLLNGTKSEKIKFEEASEVHRRIQPNGKDYWHVPCDLHEDYQVTMRVSELEIELENDDWIFTATRRLKTRFSVWKHYEETLLRTIFYLTWREYFSEIQLRVRTRWQGGHCEETTDGREMDQEELFAVLEKIAKIQARRSAPESRHDRCGYCHYKPECPNSCQPLPLTPMRKNRFLLI